MGALKILLITWLMRHCPSRGTHPTIGCNNRCYSRQCVNTTVWGRRLSTHQRWTGCIGRRDGYEPDTSTYRGVDPPIKISVSWRNKTFHMRDTDSIVSRCIRRTAGGGGTSGTRWPGWGSAGRRGGVVPCGPNGLYTRGDIFLRRHL